MILFQCTKSLSVRFYTNTNHKRQVHNLEENKFSDVYLSKLKEVMDRSHAAQAGSQSELFKLTILHE